MKKVYHKRGNQGHPHACGDYLFFLWHPWAPVASSPRVWGLRPSARQTVSGPRVIPTRVGTTGIATLDITATTGHPHACGDYDSASEPAGGLLGSSPRVWGLRLHRGADALPHRVIPTRVGTTMRATRMGRRPSGHPHACGDYGQGGGGVCSGYGSSPRVWGLLR